VSQAGWEEARGWWVAGYSVRSIAGRLAVTQQAIDYHAKRYWPPRASQQGRRPRDLPDAAAAPIVNPRVVEQLIISRATARWSQPKPSPEEIVAAYVDGRHPPRSKAWYEEWERLLEAVRTARFGPRRIT
jgi:hypothetical protein